MSAHDLQFDSPAGTLAQFRERSLRNFENRCLHHHVFDRNVLKKIFSYFGLAIVLSARFDTDYVMVGRKR